MANWLQKTLWGTLILGLIGSFIYDTLKSAIVLNAIEDLSVWIYHTILIYKLPIWVYILFTAITISLAFWIRSTIKRKKHSFLDFKSNTYGSFLWEWEYVQDTVTKKYRIKKIKPCCTECCTPLVFYEVFTCPECGSIYHEDSMTCEEIKLLIIKDILTLYPAKKMLLIEPSPNNTTPQ